MTSTAPRDQKVALVAAAVEESAQTGGDRRAEGYQIKKHETVLGSLPFPSATASNTLLVEPRQTRPATSGDSDRRGSLARNLQLPVRGSLCHRHA